MRKKPSYFDDDYDERTNNKTGFDFKMLLQVILYYIIVAIKWIRDTAISIYQKHPIEIKYDNKKITIKKKSYFDDDEDDAPPIPQMPNLDVDSVDVQREKAPRRVRFNMPLFLVITTLIGVSLIIGSFMISVNKQNNKISKFNADAGAVCAQFIKEYGATSYENLFKNYGVEGYRMTGLSYVRELDFDDDGVSELLVCYNDSGVYFVEVWAYVHGEMTSIYHGKAAQTNNKADDAWITLYHHNNKYYIGVHDEKDLTQVAIYAMHGDKFTKRSNVTYDLQDQAFTVHKKPDYESFERIKLSVLREEKAFITLERVVDTIDEFHSDKASSVSHSVSKPTYKQAYKQVLDDKIAQFGEPVYKEEEGLSYIDGVAYVKLVDFDADGNEELIIAYRKETKTRDEDKNGDYISISEYKYFTEVYSYNGAIAQLIYQHEGISQKRDSDTDKYVILKKDGNKYNLCLNSISTEENGHVEYGTSTVMELVDNKFETVSKVRYSSEYGYNEYYVDDKYVSRSEFEENIVVPFFDGTSTYSSSVFDVACLQRKADSTGNIKSVADSTKETIKSLI